MAYTTSIGELDANMSTADVAQQLQGASTPSLADAGAAGTGAAFRSLSRSQRTPGVRFGQEAKESRRSSMTDTRSDSSVPDEITPIRSADGHSDRDYQTTTSSLQAEPSSHTNAPRTEGEAPVGSTNYTDNNPRTSWFKRAADKYGSVTLDNKGSVARDHLALERTFLAWLRTSLAFASIGIAVTQLFRLNTSLASETTRSLVSACSSTLPYSPLLLQPITSEVASYLQLIDEASLQSSSSLSKLGPTLMDQLMLLSPDGQSLGPSYEWRGVHASAASAAKLRHLGKPLGATFIGISFVVLLVGFHRYFESQYWIIRGKFPASRGSIALIALIAAALIIASLVVVVVVEPSQVEQ